MNLPSPGSLWRRTKNNSIPHYTYPTHAFKSYLFQDGGPDDLLLVLGESRRIEKEKPWVLYLCGDKLGVLYPSYFHDGHLLRVDPKDTK